METLIAHRGSHDRARENTLAAFAAAADHGADMIEFDVRRTADGRLAIFHDPEVAAVPLSALTLAQLRERSGVDVPELAEVLDWAARTGIGVDVELKEDGYVAEALAPLSGFPGPTLVTSFLDPVMAQVAELAHGSTQRGLLLEWTARGALGRVHACGAHHAVLKVGLLGDGTLLDELAEAGVGAHVWGLDPKRHAAWLADGRISGVITDDVPGARRAALVSTA